MAVTVPKEDKRHFYCPEQANPAGLLEVFPIVWAEKSPHPRHGQDPCTHRGRPEAWNHPSSGGGNIRSLERHVWKCKTTSRGYESRVAGILVKCQSPWNTLPLLVRKAERNNYWLAQDLGAVNDAIITLYLVVPNPYTLLSLLPAQASRFTCLDLKNVTFCL